MANVYEVTITKRPQGAQPPQNQILVYFPTLSLRSPLAGVSSSQSVGYPTQDDAIASIDHDLRQNLQVNDLARYKGMDYQSVVDVVTAITLDKPNWV